MKAKKNNRLRWFVVWLSNHANRQDDEPVKVKARSAEDAGKKALGYSTNFSISRVFDGMAEFYRFYPGWRGLI